MCVGLYDYIADMYNIHTYVYAFYVTTCMFGHLCAHKQLCGVFYAASVCARMSARWFVLRLILTQAIQKERKKSEPETRPYDGPVSFAFVSWCACERLYLLFFFFSFRFFYCIFAVFFAFYSDSEWIVPNVTKYFSFFLSVSRCKCILLCHSIFVLFAFP